MVFSSIHFLFLFLPVVLIISHIIPLKARNFFLLFANLVFYAYGEPIYVFLMISSIIVNYTGGIVIEKTSQGKRKKLVLSVFVVLNLLALGYFKYTGMIIDTLRRIPALSELSFYDIVLPIGISFYTFQAISYIIDVYRGTCKAEKNIIDFSAYISLFPQLIAGPIVRYSDVANQLGGRRESIHTFADGIKLFCIGLAKKVLLANQYGILWNAVSQSPSEYGVIGVWLGAIFYTFQIYFDFSGYSDMARGLGKMLGFDFCINFNYPYISKNVTEFWRRWHISLSSWFLDYVYIPLGGNRVNKLRFVFNIMIVWALTGLWHGAGWNFIAWGMYYGVILLLEKLVYGKTLKKLPSFVSHVYTMFVVIIGWVFFASVSFEQSATYIKAMFCIKNGMFGDNFAMILPWLFMLIVGIIASTPLSLKIYKKLENKKYTFIAEALLVVLALVLCTASLVSESYNPFLYFRF